MSVNLFKINKGINLTPQTTAPAGENGDIYYDSSLNKFRKYENGNWRELGSGTGGSKNYLSSITTSQSSTANTGNGDFELGSTTGWSLGTTGTLTNGIPTGTPTFGSGASGNLSISTVSSSHLAGSYSLSYASSAATTQGNMLASDTFYIDNEDQSKVLTWKFYYKAQTNPTNANWSGTSSNSFGVAIYDVTNGAWLSNTANFAMTQSSGIGVATGTCQTNSNTTQLRFVMYNVNATSGAITVYFDDFSIGPQTAPIGAPMTDWVSYVPSTQGLGTPAATSVEWRRVGSNLEIRGRITVGTVTASEARVGFPTGITSSSIITTLEQAGLWARNQVSATSYYMLCEPSVTYFTMGHQNSSNAGLVKRNGNDVLTSGDIFSFQATCPIAGWSSNVQMSSDTDTRVVSFSATNNGTSLSTNLASPTTLTANWATLSDTHASFSSGVYTIPVTGWYHITFSLGTGDTATTNKGFLRINSSVVRTARTYSNGTGGATPVIAYSNYLIAGTTVDTQATSTTATQSTSSGETQLNIHRLSGPSVVAATETIAASYNTAAGPAMTAATPINFATKVFDTHSAVTTGAGVWKFTAPSSGKYQVNFAKQNTTAIAYSLYKNGAQFMGFADSVASVANGNSLLVDLIAGDYIDARPNSTSGSLTANALVNHIQIFRIGI